MKSSFRVVVVISLKSNLESLENTFFTLSTYKCNYNTVFSTLQHFKLKILFLYHYFMPYLITFTTNHYPETLY